MHGHFAEDDDSCTELFRVRHAAAKRRIRDDDLCGHVGGDRRGDGADFQDPGVPIAVAAGHDLQVGDLQACVDGGRERELAVDDDRVRDGGRVGDRDRVGRAMRTT